MKIFKSSVIYPAICKEENITTIDTYNIIQFHNLWYKSQKKVKKNAIKEKFSWMKIQSFNTFSFFIELPLVNTRNTLSILTT